MPTEPSLRAPRDASMGTTTFTGTVIKGLHLDRLNWGLGLSLLPDLPGAPATHATFVVWCRSRALQNFPPLSVTEATAIFLERWISWRLARLPVPAGALPHSSKRTVIDGIRRDGQWDWTWTLTFFSTGTYLL